MQNVLKCDRSLARVPFLPPNCPWRSQYESIVIPKVQYEFLMQRVLSPTTARYKILLSYLLWGGDRFQNKSLLLPCHLIANFFGYQDSSNINTGRLLQGFRDDVLANIADAVLDIGAHDWVEHKCRVINKVHLGVLQADFDAIGRENGPLKRAKDTPSGSMVYLQDGRTVSERKVQQGRRNSRVIREKAALCAHPVSRKLIETMDRVPDTLFGKRVNVRFDLAAIEISKIKDSHQRRSQEAILRRIDLDPKPLYFPSEHARTVRVFANGHIPNLKRNIRRILTDGWLEADLRCAQLAIASTLFDMGKTRSFLEKGGNIWNELLTPGHELSRAQRQEVKGVIKTAMYSMLYLRKEKKVAKTLQEELRGMGCKIPASEFLAHWIFRELEETSQIQATRLRKGQGLTDAFGQVHYAVNGRKPSSVMAQVNQSYELHLLEPVLDYVNAKNADGNFLVDPSEMKIVVWSHDGFNIAVRSRSRIPEYQQKLSEMVRARAIRLGIPVKLEWQ